MTIINLGNLKYLVSHALDLAGVAFLSDLMAQASANPLSSDTTVATVLGLAIAILGKAGIAWLTRNEPVQPVTFERK